MSNTLVNGAIPGFYTPTQLLDLIGSTRGSLLYRGASQWSALTPGTAGFFLQSQGAGADPIWAAASGAGLGDFSGPGASVDTGVVIFDGVSGKNGKACAVTISVAGAVAGVTTLITSGKITAGGPIELLTTVAAPGQIGKSADNGIEIWGKAGLFYDITGYNNGGSIVFGNPTGTQNLKVIGNFSAEGTGSHVFGSTNTVTLAAGLISQVSSTANQNNTQSITANSPIWNVINNNANTGRIIYGVEGLAGTTFSGSTTNAAFSGSNGVDAYHLLSNGVIGATVKAANTTFSGSITTAAPTVGAAAAWKFGVYTAGAAAQAGKLRVNVAGVDYDILTA